MNCASRPSVLLAVLLTLIGCSAGSNGGGAAPPVIAVIVSGPSTTRLLTTSQFSATVSNTANQAVTWQVNGVTGGNSTTGTISVGGLYSAPAVMPSPASVSVSAISQAAATAVGSVTDSLLNPTPVETSVVVSQVGTSLSYLVDVVGSGFVPTSSIQIGGTSVGTIFISAI
jgi:hypothetical protein